MSSLRHSKFKKKVVYCLDIDLSRSTEASLHRSEDEQCSFDSALGQQIGPHLEQLQLNDTLVKFGGDGWLLMTANPDEVSKLAGLALIMQKRFEPEMQQIIGRQAFIPPLRQVICAGNDTPILLATGAGDFAGNSARRAKRVPKEISLNSIILDEPTRLKLGNHFECETLSGDVCAGTDRPAETPAPLHRLRGLSSSAEKEPRWKYVRECSDTMPEARPSIVLRPAFEGHDWAKSLLELPNGRPAFTFAWGDLVDAQFDESSVHLEWVPEVWTPPHIVSSITWTEAYKKVDQACRDKRDFRFRPLGRVAGVQVGDSNNLMLRLQHTMYALVAATTLNLQEDGPFTRALREWADDSEEARQPFLASALNVIGCVLSKDDCLILPQRSSVAYEQPGTLQPSAGGYVEHGETAGYAFRREIQEELGFLETDPLEVTFLGFGYNGRTGEPDLLALARTSLTGAEMCERYTSRRKEKAPEDELLNLQNEWFWELGSDPDSATLKRLCWNLWAAGSWSQPSDRVAVVAMLCRVYGKTVISEAVRRSRGRR